jgi:GH25 family lysozyme M1 (1,4-beta-N-acetylmuramidase)
MAYIDDNYDLSSGAGDDPLKALDKELDELRATLGELDEPSVKAEAPAPQPDIKPQAPPQPAPVHRNNNTPPAAQPQPSPAPQPPRKRSPLVPILLIAAAVITVLLAFVLPRILSPEEQNTQLSHGGETITIDDSVLGTVEIQTVEGVTLNTYDAENLVREENGFYSYYVDGKKVSEMGVDLSEYQGEFSFADLKAAGIDFVMLRLGGRYYSEAGGLYSDAAFDDYYAAAKAAGLKVGAYFFSQAASVADAQEEAAYALGLLNGKRLDYPLAFDWETIEDDEARTDGITGEQLTAIAAAFCDAVKDGGYTPVVYASTSLILQTYDFETMKAYDFWLADYREFPESDRMYYNFTMWQYTTDGVIDGVEGTVDLNLCLNPY